MKVLINERLSEHKYKTPEGYLICQDAILARTGKQTYRRNEVFNDSSDEEVEVDRKPEQVFSPQTLASFENKPVTVEHPDEDVNPNNYKEYSVGFVRDVHKGVADGQDVILGTLVITDAKTIEEIENGEHTELSCGYDCDIEDNDAPEQKNIRGNHVALCEQGRAGIARIVDSDVNDESPTYQYYRKEILKAKNKAEMDDLEFNIEEDYDKKKITFEEYMRLHRSINSLKTTLDSVEDAKPDFDSYVEKINKSKSKNEIDDWLEEIEEDYHKDQLTQKEYKLLISKADRAKGKFKDSADVFNDLRRRIYGTKDNYYGFNLLLKSIERARQYGTLEDREAEILTELWQETKKKYYAKDLVEDAEENYNDLRKRILNTKNNKDEFEGILNRIERSKSAKAISEIEANLLKKFWNEKKEQYYPKNPVQKVEGMVIEYVDGIDHQKKYIRVKTGTYSKAQGIYRILQSKNPKKYSSQYGLIPMGGSQVQEWKPFMQTHPNAKFEEVYDMKDAKNYSKMNDLGYQYFENRLRENGAKIKHTHVQSENPYTLIYDVELEGTANKLKTILQSMGGSLKRYGIDMTYDLNENYPPKAKIITKVTSTKDSMTKDMSDEDYEDLIDDLLDAGITHFDEGRINNYQRLYFYNRSDLEKAKRTAGRYANICKMKGEKDSVKDGRWLIKGDFEDVKKLLLSSGIGVKQFVSSLIGRNQYTVKVTFANADEMEKAKKLLWSSHKYDVTEGKNAYGYYLTIGSTIYDSKPKDDFSTKSAQGYSVERIERANSGRYYAILKRPMGDYVVAAGYDLKDGTWGQGYYDYKTYEDALKGIKKAKARAGDSVKDAMPVYEIRWIDLYKKSKGYPDFKYLAEIKANSLREALEKLKAKVVMGGVGTHNAMIMNIHGNGKTYMYNGRLDEVLAMNIKDSSGIKTRELD